MMTGLELGVPADLAGECRILRSGMVAEPRRYTWFCVANISSDLTTVHASKVKRHSSFISIVFLSYVNVHPQVINREILVDHPTKQVSRLCICNLSADFQIRPTNMQIPGRHQIANF